MSLDAERTVRAAVDRVRSTAALALAAVLFVASPPTTILPIDPLLTARPIEFLVRRPVETLDSILRDPTNLLAFLVVAGVFLVVVGVTLAVTLAVSLVAVRTFAADERARIRTDHVTRRPVAYLHFVAGAVGYLLAVAVGLAFLVAPGVFLAVSLAFWPVAVAVEDDGFLGGFRRSWTLAAGDRWGVLAVAFLAVVLVAFVVGLFSVVGGPFLATAGVALGGIFGIAVLVEAHQELDDDQGITPESVGERSASAGDDPDR